MTLAIALTDEAQRAGLAVSPELADACERHHRLLVRWNRTHNLTRVTDAHEAARRHYLDSLWPALVASDTDRSDTIDVGSGAGFPGLLFALAWPNVQMALVEPAAKRASFLKLAIAELGLMSRVRVTAPPAPRSGLVLSRATFPRGERQPLSDAVAPNGALWLWSVPSEVPGWPAEATTLGLRALPPLERDLHGERRVILRAVRDPTP